MKKNRKNGKERENEKRPENKWETGKETKQKRDNEENQLMGATKEKQEKE